MNCQSDIHRLKSEYAEALILAKAAALVPDAFFLLNIAQIEVESGAPKPDVQRNIDTARTILSAVGHPMLMIYCNATQAALDAREGARSAAGSVFHKCLSFTWGKDTEVISYCFERLADSRLWPTASPTSAMTYLILSLSLKQSLDNYKALQFLGDVFLTQGDHETATSLLTVALEGLTRMDGSQIASVDKRLAGISDDLGNLARLSDLNVPLASPTTSNAQPTGAIVAEIEEFGNMVLEDDRDPVLVSA
ncbi:hypothetical protein FB451DRAFT_1180332 [Mycena latifolia]|nr:hypothetical protein FB451DRAFT_1180332 [Mycena latifolia]